MERRGRPDRLLAVRPGGRTSCRGLDAGAGVVLGDGHLLRRAGVRDARRGARVARRPRQDRDRRQRANPDRHLQRPSPGAGVRGEPVRRAGGRHAERGHAESHRRADGQPRRRAGHRGSQRGFRLRIEGPGHRLRLRGGDPHPVQEHSLPAPKRADLGSQHPPAGAALGLPGHVGAGPAGERLVPGPVRDPHRAHRPAARPRARCHARDHGTGGRRAGHPRMALRGGEPAARRDGALGRHEQLDARRHGQPRLLAGRGGRRSDFLRPESRPVLPGKAPLLSRGDGVLRHPQPAHLHAPPAPSGRRPQAHWQDRRHHGGGAPRAR